MLFSSFSILEHSAVTLAATNAFDICFNRFNLWLGKQYMEYTNKSNGKWILSLTQWQWLQCTQPGGKKNRVNYCFKSSCEINETLRALCWLKRSLPTFNRLFNLTQLELCVCSFLPFLNTVACTAHANSPATCRDVFTNEDWMPPCMWSELVPIKQHW